MLEVKNNSLELQIYVFEACPSVRGISWVLLYLQGGERGLRNQTSGPTTIQRRVTSKKVRTIGKAVFVNAFDSHPLGRDDDLRILDVGCGLGFLSCVSAEFYRNARVTGVDTFEHISLKRSSLDGAKENARTLGLLDTINLKRVMCLGSTSSSLTCFITLGRCDSRPIPSFHHGHRLVPSS